MFRESVSTIIGSKAPPVSTCDQRAVPIVLKSLGVELRGRQSLLGSVRTYFGIPYAANTGGANRFQLPKNTTGIGAVDKVFYAHQHGPRCPQDKATLQNSSEDCLTLSIWAPPQCSKVDPPFDVIVVLSSDWFQRGYAREHESTWDALASSGRLIVVYIQHRLGVLGFLDAGVEDSPGNQGIEDAFLALDWISDNIEVFNGDPNSLVGLGHGSGSYIASLDLFAATWRRRRFFKRLILLGLTPTSLLPRGGSASFGPLVKRLKCDKEDNVSASIACLREVPLEKMFEETAKEAPLTFMPSCGKPPIGDCGNASVELPDVFLHKEMLCGFDQEDGRRLLDSFVLQEQPASNDPSTVFDRLQRFFTRKEPKQKFSSLSPYAQKALNQSDMQGLRDLVVDMVLRCPLLRLARAAVLKGSRVYLYASAGPNRVFEPALTKEDITDFAKNGKANWRAYNEHSSVLVVTASSKIVMEWGEKVCALANNLTLKIFS